MFSVYWFFAPKKKLRKDVRVRFPDPKFDPQARPQETQAPRGAHSREARGSGSSHLMNDETPREAHLDNDEDQTASARNEKKGVTSQGEVTPPLPTEEEPRVAPENIGAGDPFVRAFI